MTTIRTISLASTRYNRICPKIYPQTGLNKNYHQSKQYNRNNLKDACIIPMFSFKPGNDDESSYNSKVDEQKMEEARIKILNNRRKQIRTILKGAESLRNYRLSKGYIPEIDPKTGKPISDSKVALSLTAFVVAGGAIALRIGGRAALLSAVGLDFLSESPELKDNLDLVLETTDSMNIGVKLLAFIAAWTIIKLLCFDFGGVVLALSSGILFGGVVQGAVISAAAATIGSMAAFGLAKLDTPVRQKALELLEQYPSLRGIDKVVAKDGLKAVLTLRLAPVLPIPIGLYNYIYGVSNVPLPAFAGGIFLGSLKPYFLDSYLGYFGKDIVQGNVDATGLQDFLLLGALGVSVLIGVFASQLAAETWDSVIEEVEVEKKEKQKLQQDDNIENNQEDGIVRNILGIEVPEWIVGFQLAIKEADNDVNDVILTEYQSKVWNYTKEEPPPFELDPANFAGSPELEGAYRGIDLGASLCEGLVLSPIMFQAFFKYADPCYDESKDEKLMNRPKPRLVIGGAATEKTRKTLISQIQNLRIRTLERITLLDDKIQQSK